MQLNLPSALRPVYIKLVLVGGVLLVVGLFSPWYYLFEKVDGGWYFMSAFGGSLVDKVDVEFFNPLAGWISFGFALVCIALPFVIARLRLPERSRTKYVAVAGSLAGVCGLLSVIYFHSWLDLAYPEDSFFFSDVNVSRGLGFGYLLAWVGVALVFLATYVSRGLVSEVKKEDSVRFSRLLVHLYRGGCMCVCVRHSL